ncbi:MAG: substrate-binding domain-containing protein, partial [Anaerolineae bacterium]|nr:substrate-binding domain-containing protein [Anaerolineae bacterium]
MSNQKMTRRDFLKYAGLASGAAMAASVLGSLPAAAAEAGEQSASFQFPHIQKKEFEGVTVRMLAISGANYDELYKIIPEWEEQTGAKVEFVFKGDGFQTDKRLVQDFAAGTVDYDVCWDHSSFFSQYVKAGGLEPLDNWFTEEELADFIPRLLD